VAAPPVVFLEDRRYHNLMTANDPRHAKYLSVAAMREADRRCIEDLGMPGAVLMNQAGAAVYRELPPGPVTVVCGKGNNGGDGFVVARLALLDGRDVRVLLHAEPSALGGDAALFHNVYRKLGGTVTPIVEPGEVAQAYESRRSGGVWVDSILGTGIRGEVTGIARAAIDLWPPEHTVSVDVPSGMDADTGAPCGCCVRADVTVTFQFGKEGFLAPDAQPWLGRLVVADIGIPDLCADDTAWNQLVTGWTNSGS
jgi:hydroxyethylthiazole kinase-like uncharacterized protein yjeF